MSGKKSSTRRKFTRRPKMQELVENGVPLRAIPVYDALSDFCDNTTGKTIVAVEKIAEILKVHRRTVERHLSALEDAGVIKRQRQRRTARGRFSSCLWVVISFALFTVRQPAKYRKRASYKDSLSKPVPTHKSKEEVRAEDRARRHAAFEGREWLLQ